MTRSANGPGVDRTPGQGGERPPPGVVQAAEADCERMKDKLEEFIAKVQGLLASGWTDFEAVVDVYRIMRMQPGTQMILLNAIALVRLAKSPGPPLGEPTDLPDARSR